MEWWLEMESIRHKTEYMNQKPSGLDYSYDRNAARKLRPELEPQIKRPVRKPTAVPGLSSEPKPRHKRKTRVSLGFIVVCLAATLLLGGIISMYSQLTELSISSYALQKEVTALEKEQSSLQYEINSQKTMLEIEQYARNILGMVKADDTNVTYLQNGNTDSFEIAENRGPGGIAGYVLEKLGCYAKAVWSFIN